MAVYKCVDLHISQCHGHSYSYCIAQDENGDTALIQASFQGHLECATVLLKHGADVHYQRKVKRSF